MIDVFPVHKDGERIGEVTSACYSPRLEKNIGFAMVPIEQAGLGTEYEIEKPDETVGAVMVPKPFVDPKKETPKQEVASGRRLLQSGEPRRSGALTHSDVVRRGGSAAAQPLLHLVLVLLDPVLAASSGSSLSPAIALATASWSSFVSFIFFSTSYAGEPLSANFLLKSFSMIVTSYAHLYCSGSPPALASSLQPVGVLGGSLTSARSYSWLRYCGVYQ